MGGARDFRKYSVWKEAVDYATYVYEVHFLDFALGSAFEVETQLTIAKNIGYFDNTDVSRDINFQVLMDRIHSIERQLNGLITSIRKS